MWRISTEIQLTPLPGCHLIHTILSTLLTKSVPPSFNAQPLSRAITIAASFNIASLSSPPHHHHWPILCMPTCDLFLLSLPFSSEFAAPALSTIRFIHVSIYFTATDQDEQTNQLNDGRTEEEDMYEQTATKHDIRPLIYGPWKMSIADTFTPTIPHLWPCSSGWPFPNTRHVTVNVASSSFLIKHRRGQRKWGRVWEEMSPTFVPIDGRVDTIRNKSKQPRGTQ